MKPRRSILKNLPSLRSNSPRYIRLMLGGALMTSAVSSAATQYWDPGLTPTANGNKGSGGNGTFTVAGTNWTDGNTNTTDAVLTATNITGFAGSAGTVTIGSSTTLTTGGVQVETNNYIIGTGTSSSQLFLAAQTGIPGGIVLSSGVTGTQFNVAAIRVGSVSGNIPFTNTDLVNFNNSTIYLSGNRTTDLVNSSTSGTTTFAKFAVTDKTALNGSWATTVISLNTGNLTINSLAGASSATGTLVAYQNNNVGQVYQTTFGGSGSGTLTINGNNTLYLNSSTGNPLIFKGAAEFLVGSGRADFDS